MIIKFTSFKLFYGELWDAERESSQNMNACFKELSKNEHPYNVTRKRIVPASWAHVLTTLPQYPSPLFPIGNPNLIFYRNYFSLFFIVYHLSMYH